MIKESKALSMSEAKEFIDNSSNDDLKGFVKNFVTLEPEKAKKLREELENIDNMKIKEEHISKLIDLLPEDSEDINKIFSDADLDENETNQILETIKPYR